MGGVSGANSAANFKPQCLKSTDGPDGCGQSAQLPFGRSRSEDSTLRRWGMVQTLAC